MKNRTTIWKTIGILGIAACGALIPSRSVADEGGNPTNTAAVAVSGGPSEDKWVFTMPLLLWAPSIGGNVTVRGQTSDVDVDFSELKQHIQKGFMGYFELANQKYGFYANPNWLELYVKDKHGSVKVTDTLNIVFAEFGGFYTVGRWDEERPLTLDVIAGGRYWSFDSDLKLNDKTIPLKIKKSFSDQFIDPLVGLRIRKQLTEKLTLSQRGDLAGFALSQGTTTTFSWHSRTLLGYDLTRFFVVFGGYEALGMKVADSNGNGKNGVDLTLYGPLLGFNFDLFGWLEARKASR